MAVKKKIPTLPLYKGEDQTGKIFGNWEVLGFAEWDNKNYNHKWECICLKCMRHFNVTASNLILGKSKSCVSCAPLIGSNNGNWTGYKDIPGWLWYRITYGANIRNINIDITKEDLQELWEKSNKKCKLSGLDIDINTTASLDRIDSTKPYIKGNIQWVHKDINKIKINFQQEYFLQLCKLITEYNNNND